MRRVIVLLSVVACLALVVGCSNPVGDIGEDQPIFLCDPVITVHHASGRPGTDIRLPVTVDMNVHSLYPGLLEKVELNFDYVIDAVVWNTLDLEDEAWNIDYGPDGVEYELVDTDNASLTVDLHPDGAAFTVATPLLITIYATVEVRYNVDEDEDQWQSQQTYQFHHQETITIPFS